MQRDYTGRKYEVIPYDPSWPQAFEKEAQLIADIFRDDAVVIEHIGSTSVPSMKGKPLIDVLILVDDITYADGHAGEMEAAGFTNKGDLLNKGSRLFIRENDGHNLTNVHVYKKDHLHVAEMLGLRDYLRSHPDEVARYSALKHELFEKYPDDYGSYRREKDAFMEGMKERALDWFVEKKGR